MNNIEDTARTEKTFQLSVNFVQPLCLCVNLTVAIINYREDLPLAYSGIVNSRRA